MATGTPMIYLFIYIYIHIHYIYIFQCIFMYILFSTSYIISYHDVSFNDIISKYVANFCNFRWLSIKPIKPTTQTKPSKQPLVTKSLKWVFHGYPIKKTGCNPANHHDPMGHGLLPMPPTLPMLPWRPQRGAMATPDPTSAGKQWSKIGWPCWKSDGMVRLRCFSVKADV